ncbi:SDR family NAD(P)-dependent oxidoreductase [Paenibacillus uliginis]|uniref:SDR family NAD(P)-dependent oxidoreductase n=1 Tax=Paenibacillus uliginis TaxID=683737 RepID=UPI001FCD549A|nr:SDR family NAD(P)-dependent oxidoreductase [Paenibacillus uliginis]
MLDENHHIFCISRTSNRRLIELAKEKNNRLSYHPFDLNNLSGIDQLFEELFNTIQHESEIDAVHLINNAGMLSPVAPIELNSADCIIENVNINLLAPMIFTSNFIKHTLELNVDKRIMNISSASAKYLLPSQSCYSTSKAGLDSFQERELGTAE